MVEERAEDSKDMTEQKRIKVTLVKGLRGALSRHRETVKGLGLRHREHTVELVDTPSVRGMIKQVSYLVKVEG